MASMALLFFSDDASMGDMRGEGMLWETCMLEAP